MGDKPAVTLSADAVKCLVLLCLFNINDCLIYADVSPQMESFHEGKMFDGQAPCPGGSVNHLLSWPLIAEVGGANVVWILGPLLADRSPCNVSQLSTETKSRKLFQLPSPKLPECPTSTATIRK